MNAIVKKEILAFVILMILALTACGNNEKTEVQNSGAEEDMDSANMTVAVEIVKPWENGGKAIEEYTWEEFEALSTELKDAFFNTFESVEAFDAWKNRVQDTGYAQEEKPWENGGKAIEEYTWEEFEALSTELKDAFFNTFESVEAFDAWKNRAQAADYEQEERPWENGGKAIEEYTWEEFEALSTELKDAFFNAFESVEAFESWKETANS